MRALKKEGHIKDSALFLSTHLDLDREKGEAEAVAMLTKTWKGD